MRPRRLPVAALWPIALVVLVGSLAWLQYRWVGQVSAADRDRLQASLKERAQEFSDDFDRELLRVYLGLQVDATPILRGDASQFAARYDAWRTAARAPEIVRGIFLVDAAGGRLLQYSPERRVFSPVAWPADLAPLRPPDAGVKTGAGAATGYRVNASRDGALIAKILRDAGAPLLSTPLAPSVPAITISLPSITPTAAMASNARPDALQWRFSQASLIVWLDRDAIRSSFLPALAAQYFPDRGVDTYRIAVVSAAHPSDAVFTRGLAPAATIASTQADVSVPLFAIRSDMADQVAPAKFIARGFSVSKQDDRTTARAAAPASTGRLSLFVETRELSAQTTRAIAVGPAGAWQLRLQHSKGSLDAAVNDARRKNLALSFGILALLAVSVGLILVNAERSRRLAAQQMDFVATVSHELRTPLAVIRSAAQNLAAGVVHDASHAKRYGDLIEDEGRRLTGMIEEVLAFAGLAGNRRPPNAHPVDASAIVRDVAASHAGLAADARVTIAVEIARDAPAASADEPALGRAIGNLVANAIKYGADGGWVGVAVARSPDGRSVQIAVSDRGRGIDAADLPHVFEPFYRGRRAIDGQIQGNGLGLALVKRIADAYGGRVTARSTPGQGATFTIDLPAAAADAIPAPAADALAQAAAGADPIR